jgi:hypothetical protein
MKDERKFPFWAKCPACGHCWPDAYFPMDIETLARGIKKTCCPHGCKNAPVLAKQRDGQLMEVSA